jgi:hypothetical protein
MEKAKTTEILGHFQLVREIGRKGMGIVYEARQVSLNRRVALKVLSSGLGLTAKAVQRFRRQAEAAAKLHNTNMVPIYATGEEHGVHFCAMELIDGPSLDQVIRLLHQGNALAEQSQDLDSTVDSPSSSEVPNWVLPRHRATRRPSTPATRRPSPHATGKKLVRAGSLLLSHTAPAGLYREAVIFRGPGSSRSGAPWVVRPHTTDTPQAFYRAGRGIHRARDPLSNPCGVEELRGFGAQSHLFRILSHMPFSRPRAW